MKDLPSARELARTMVDIGNDHGVRTVALLTDMQSPLGRQVGNALEVAEAVEVLSGGGPADVVELTVALAREMLAAAGLTPGEDGIKDPAEALRDGSALRSWKDMIRAQGGDPDAPLPEAAESRVVLAPSSGVVTRLDAYQVGLAAWRLGAGRARKEDAVSFGAGVTLHAKPGEEVVAGEPLFTLHADEAERFEWAAEALEGACDIGGADEWTPTPLVIDRVA